MNEEEIKPPRNYAEWARALDFLKAKTDDGAVLAALRQGELEWQAGLAERFSRKLIDCINTRMDAASDRFQKEMSHTRGQEGQIVQALLNLRKEMNFLTKVTDLPVIPEKERSRYCQLVREQADRMQASLEDSAKKDRSGKMGSIVRNNRVNMF